MQKTNPKPKCKVIDFSSEYSKRHGKKPGEPGLKLMQAHMGAIDKTLSFDPKKVIVEMNLEDFSCKLEHHKQVRKDDLVIIRAGKAEFRLIFTQINENNRLMAFALNNGRFDYPFGIAFDSCEKVWSGHLMDLSYFEVHIRRLPSFTLEQGVLANVEIFAQVHRAVY